MQRDPPVGAGPSPRPRLQVEGRLRALSLMARGAALYFGRTSPRLPSTHYHGLRLTTRLARIRSYLVRDPVYSFGVQVGVGVLVCEALRERSEQRANKYPAAACTAGRRSRAGARSYREVAGWGPLLRLLARIGTLPCLSWIDDAYQPFLGCRRD